MRHALFPALLLAATLGAAQPAHCQAPAPVDTSAPAAPEPPRHTVDVTPPPAARDTITVTTAAELQPAIDRATPGTLVQLPRGVNWAQRIVLRKKDAALYAGPIVSPWIEIVTAGVPLPRGVRADTASLPALELAQLGTRTTDPIIETEPGAHHYWLRHLEVRPDSSVGLPGDLVKCGSSGAEQDTPEEVPHHVVLEQVVVRGWAHSGTKRGVLMNCAWFALVDSWVSDVHRRGQDTQAVGGWNGPGPVKLRNNHLSGAGETILFGGADPSIAGLVTEDVVIEDNDLHIPGAWREAGWQVKNLFEIKSARRVVFARNRLDGSYGAQEGIWANVKSANQNGKCTWCAAQDVLIRDNRVRNAGSGITIVGQECSGDGCRAKMTGFTARVRVVNNVVETLNRGEPYTGRNLPHLLGDGVRDLAIDSNTVRGETSAWAAMLGYNTAVLPRLRFEGNVLPLGRYGFHAFGTGAPYGAIRGNLLVGASRSYYPKSNEYVPTWAAFDSLAARGALPLVAGAATTPGTAWQVTTKLVTVTTITQHADTVVRRWADTTMAPIPVTDSIRVPVPGVPAFPPAPTHQ